MNDKASLLFMVSFWPSLYHLKFVLINYAFVWLHTLVSFTTKEVRFHKKQPMFQWAAFSRCQCLRNYLNLAVVEHFSTIKLHV